MPELESIARLDQILAIYPEDNDGEKRVYRIGDLASEFGVTLRTLRFYEDRGLISPERDGSTRLYSPKDRSRLKVILLAKKVGFPLVEIQELMEIYDQSDDIDDPAGILLKRFSQQMDVLTRQKAEIEAAIEKLKETIGTLKASA
ncbi:MAG: MerR family DNA-binding transcriptional regulator [Nitratireductor sp.]|nr:MerR family DNA-binding transcriptional regulator [Nitratireductor sp.]